jgi:hypothetical protein
MTRFYGKMHIPTTEKLEGKVLICISNKYGNFTKGKLYKVIVEARNRLCEATNYRITDDDGDWYSIGKNDIGKIFEIYEGNGPMNRLPDAIIERLKSIPETGIRYHRAKIVFKDGKERRVTVFNGTIIDEDIDMENIIDIIKDR